MFVDFTDYADRRRDRWTDLPADEALLVWALRRFVVAWPRSAAVEVALHRRFGDEAQGVLQLLRCWLAGLAVHAERPLTIGDPACALLLADEGAMLFVLRSGGAAAEAALTGLCGSRGAVALAPVATALRAAISA